MSSERESLAAQIIVEARVVSKMQTGSEAWAYSSSRLEKLLDEYDSPLPSHGGLESMNGAAVDVGAGHLEFVYAKGLDDAADWLTGDAIQDRAMLRKHAKTMRDRK